MELALAEARAAAAEGEVPVGAVALIAGCLVAARHNERERTGDPTAHAEMLVLRDTAAAVGGWRLSEVTIVVTLEPCPMCAGALVAARVRRLVYGASDPRAGACGTLYNLCADPRLNHELPVTNGVRADECGALLTSFFAEKRAERTEREGAPDTGKHLNGVPGRTLHDSGGSLGREGPWTTQASSRSPTPAAPWSHASRSRSDGRAPAGPQVRAAQPGMLVTSFSCAGWRPEWAPL